MGTGVIDFENGHYNRIESYNEIFRHVTRENAKGIGRVPVRGENASNCLFFVHPNGKTL